MIRIFFFLVESGGNENITEMLKVLTKIFFEVYGKFLRANLSGPFPLSDMDEVLTRIRKEAEAEFVFHIFLDILHLSLPRSSSDRFIAGTRIAEIFGDKYRIAVLTPPHLINKIAENTANSRGGVMCVVGSEQQALQWLLELS